MNTHDTIVSIESPKARSIADFLFPAPAKRNSLDIWLWWEKRRIPYNLIVGGVGGLATLYMGVMTTLLEGPGEWIPIEGFLMVGLMANVCYTLGPVLEVAVHKLFGRSVLPIGPALFRMGLTFSLGLPLIPVGIISIVAVLSVLGVLVP